MKFLVKNEQSKLNKQQSLLLILLLFSITFCSVSTMAAESVISNILSKELKKSERVNALPSDIIRFTESDKPFDTNLNIDVSLKDPLKYMALKQEVINLYLGDKLHVPIRFKQNNPNQQGTCQNVTNSDKNLYKMNIANSNDLMTNREMKIIPNEIGGIGAANFKTYSNKEEIVPIANLIADSNYIQYGKQKEVIMKFDAMSMLETGKFWCSAGNHDAKDEVKFFIEFSRSVPLTAMWIHWAFAPGEFRVKYSNDKLNWDDLLGGYRLSIKNGDVNWWRSVLMNPKKRWEYKSFDERINFDEPFFARYIELSMRIPVNQYFGIYNVEFYTKSKSIVMLKSKNVNSEVCISVANGIMMDLSPVFAINCLQAISYGDNRELWELNSNGYITTHKNKKCLQSPNSDEVNIMDCSKSIDYKDDRDRWIIDYDGKIRSVKEQFTCLTLVDHSVGDTLSAGEVRATASSIENSGRHNPENAFDNNSSSYWASNPATNEVIFEIYFSKYSILIKRVEIEWKFPAKVFKVKGMLADGYWKVFHNSKDNRDTTVDINMNNHDLIGIKIMMSESTTKLEQKNVYGINLINIHTGAQSLVREPCTKILGGANLWDLVYVNELDDVTGQEYKKELARLHLSLNKFETIKSRFLKIPNTLMTLRENAADIRKKILKIGSSFDDLEKRMVKYEEILQKTNYNIYTLAANQFYPAYDCAYIIKSSPHKRSGYYWIKNECMAKPLRVYCDFDLYDKKGGLDYYIFNDNQTINSIMSEIKNFKDVQLACNKIGLEPIEIKNYKMLRQIIKLLKDNRYNFNEESNNFLPIGYDYSCDYSTCSKLYRSFNKPQTSDINDIFSYYSKENNSNLLLSIFKNSDLNQDTLKNTAGVGKNFRIEYGNLSKQRVVAVVCSTNKDGSKREKNYINLECDSNIREDVYGKLEIFSHLRFICPRNCSQNKATVYGTNIYTDNSSVCKAAIHSGAIRDSGGIVELGVEPGRNNYKGSSAHNIETVDYVDKWDRSFTISKYNPYCPIDRIRDYANAMSISSFLSFDEQSTLVDKLKNNLVNQINDLIMDKTIDKSHSDNRVQKLLLASELVRFIQKNEIKSSTSLASNLHESNNNKLNLQQMKITTEEAIANLSAINNKEVDNIKNISQISSTFKILLGQSSNHIQVLITDKSTGLNSLEIQFHSYESKINDINKLIFEIDSKALTQLRKSEHQIEKLQQIARKGVNRENFTEDYNSKDIIEKYEIFNSLKGVGEIAKWEYFLYNLEGHFKTIKQTGEFIDNKTGSHLIIKDRDFYDFEIRFSVSIKGNQTFGLCFRYRDSFNYYIFEISNIGKGFKRIRKFLKGQPQTLDIKYDGGYVQNTWYNIKIRGQQSSFKIYMTMDNSPKMNDNYDLIFEFVDNELVHGTFAFTSYGLTSLMIDNISAIHIPCTDVNANSRENFTFLTPSCPRYFEELTSFYTNIWKKFDPLDYIAGPSNWIKMKNIDGRENVLAQTSLIYGSSQNEEGTIYLLNQPTKVCSKGKISVKFKALDSGLIGIVFRFNTESESFYIVEISGGVEKFVRMRRKIGNSYTLLSIRELIGYSPNIWMKIVIYMNDNKFNIYTYDKESFEMKKLFETDLIDNEIKFGLFGLSTYKTRAYFDDIRLDTVEESVHSIQISNDSLDKLYVDREMLPLPKKQISSSLFDRLNTNISNFSWGMCVKYGSPDDKIKLCDMLFKSHSEIEKCKSNFCGSCCQKQTDRTNPHHEFLCTKQCRILDISTNLNTSWKNCYEPVSSKKSVYPYCETIFDKDFFLMTRCKQDMCNLCCSSFDFTNKSKISKLNLNNCYKGCLKNFDVKPNKV